MKRLSPAAFVVLLLLGIVFIGYVLYPLSMMISESLHVGGTFSLGSYRSLLSLSNRANAEAVGNSVFISVLSVIFSSLLGILFAFVFSQFDFRFRSVLSRLVVLPIALPPLVGVISFLFVFGESGILPRGLQRLLGTAGVPFFLDGIPAIVAVHVYSFNVYFYLFLTTAFRQLDGSLLEASANLGSTPWNTFRRIMLPELTPALLGASILTFMVSMASFSAPFIFAGSKRFMTMEIYASKLNGDMSLASAQSTVLTLISVAFFLLLTFSGGRRLGSPRAKGVARAGRLAVPKAMRILLTGLAVFILLLEFLPLATIILVSFAREGAWTRQILPPVYTGENYFRLLMDPGVFGPIRNSLLMGLIALAAAVLVGVTSAYFITKGRLGRARSAFDVILTIPYAIPGTVVAICLILAFNVPNVFDGYSILVGTFWILPLAYFVREYPLVVRSTAAALEQLDDSLLEAAESFGAGFWRKFRKVVLPLVLPGIVSGGLLVMIAAIGEFVSSVMLYSYSSRPVSIAILEQIRIFNFGSAAAYSVVLLAVILVLISIASAVSNRFERRWS